MSASEEDRLSETELTGQISYVSALSYFWRILRLSSTFVFAATDTTSSALSRILVQLSTHPDAQDKLRDEIRAAYEDKDQLTYDELNNLPYLDAVIRETLRM